MTSWNEKQSGPTNWIDYSPGRCRCRNVVLPHEVKCSKCGRDQSLLFAGLDRLYEEDLDGLLDYHLSEVKKFPDDPVRVNQLAGAYLLKGDYEKARDLYFRVAELAPDFAEAHLNLGGVLAYLGDSESAIRELNEFVKLDLHSPRVERAIRAISRLKDDPYEDGVRKQDRKPLPAPGTLSRRLSTGYGPPQSPKPIVKKKKSWGPIDIILLVLILLCVAGWYLLPVESRSILDAAVQNIESRYEFTVSNSELTEFEGTSDDENGTGANRGDDESDDDEHGIINSNPATSSYLPLAHGNRWEYVIYDTRDPSGSGTRRNETVLVMTVRGYANEAEGVWEVRNGDITVYFMEKPNGIFSVINTRIPWASKIIQVPIPPDIGAARTSEGQTVTIIAEEVIETPAGLVDTIKLKYTVGLPRGTEWYIWYGRGIGIVKYVGGGRDRMYHVRELREYELN